MDPNIDFWGGGIVKGRGKFDIPLAGGAVYIHRGLQEGFKPRGWIDIIDYFLLKTLLSLSAPCFLLGFLYWEILSFYLFSTKVGQLYGFTRRSFSDFRDIRVLFVLQFGNTCFSFVSTANLEID